MKVQLINVVKKNLIKLHHVAQVFIHINLLIMNKKSHPDLKSYF